VPYHIIIEVAYDKEPDKPSKFKSPADVENNELSSPRRIFGSPTKKGNSITKTLS